MEQQHYPNDHHAVPLQASRTRAENSILQQLCFAFLLAALSCLMLAPVQADSLNLLINGKAIHLEQPKNTSEKYNESNWGAGIQYDFMPTENQWTPFMSVGGFRDSFKEGS